MIYPREIKYEHISHETVEHLYQGLWVNLESAPSIFKSNFYWKGKYTTSCGSSIIFLFTIKHSNQCYSFWESLIWFSTLKQFEASIRKDLSICVDISQFRNYNGLLNLDTPELYSFRYYIYTEVISVQGESTALLGDILEIIRLCLTPLHARVNEELISQPGITSRPVFRSTGG